MSTVPQRQPLGSAVSSGNITRQTPVADKRDEAREASLYALTGRQGSGLVGEMDMSQQGSIEVGDTVEVPGGMTGVVKYVGAVEGKKGTFAGVELSKEFASRGKNDGDVDGVRYFTTSVSGAGIFLPSHRATKQESPTLSASTLPPTPTTPSFQSFDLAAKKANSMKHTPPTPSIPKFSQSIGPGAPHPFSQTVGPGVRAPSPQLKAKGRPSLPRPESPLRKQPSLQPSTTGRPSLRGIRPPGSPAPAVPPKNGNTSTPTPAARSTSRSQSRQSTSQATSSPPEEQTPQPTFGLAKPRGRPSLTNQTPANNEEVQRLTEKLEERDKQLKDQASSLAEMESSLAELQTLMANNAAEKSVPQVAVEPGTESADLTQLRAVLKEKTDKISMLTAEFDSHRADFRSTIDALETASTETERVYEKRIQELLQEVDELQTGREDVATVANQLRQLEELVQDLEEGLEDARRGEAEAKGEVEFLRGEIERARLELRREREKAAKALKGAGAAVGENGSDGSRNSKDLEARDDEIRGLKAIIHSLSSGPDIGSPGPEVRANGVQGDQADVHSEELRELRDAITSLQNEKSELQGLVDRKNFREEELERENTRLRSAGSDAPNGSGTFFKHSKTDSSSTATMHTANRNSATSTKTTIRSGSRSSFPPPARTGSRDDSAAAGRQESELAALDEKSSETEADDTVSSTADTDTQWCEICEAAGHDILTCSRMFGENASRAKERQDVDDGEQTDDQDVTVTALSPTDANGPSRSSLERRKDSQTLSPPSSKAVPEPAASAPAQPPQPDADGPAAGKSSGVVDMTKWCALCERDGHESVDCPFEEEYY